MKACQPQPPLQGHTSQLTSTMPALPGRIEEMQEKKKSLGIGGNSGDD